MLWIENLEAIEHLRTGIGLRGYGQREPLIEYKKESFELFQQLLSLIQEQVARSIYKMGLAAAAPMPAIQNQPVQTARPAFNQFGQNQKRNQQQETTQPASRKTIDSAGNKVGRNDPCPCGSGKKFKKCCGT